MTLATADEAPTRRLDGAAGRLAATLAVALSLYALYWVLFVVQPQVYRVSFLLVSLVLCFLLFPRTRGDEARVALTDWALIAASIAALAWPLVDFQAFIYRAADPRGIDVALGAATVLLVLEATRRTVGWILPVTAGLFLAYAWLGPELDAIGLSDFAHRGYPPARLIGTLYMTLEGIFGVPLDVAATYIILFTIYGAVLERSGAGQFFIDWAMAAMGRSRSGAAPGRSVTLAGFLLGTVSGSGVATTVMLGSVSWPLLRRAGFTPETGGAILSAAGIGALLSPPTLGAAAFLIAEFLRISYLQVLVMATIPTLLYYLSIFLMIEADSRRAGTVAVTVETPGVWALTKRSGYHFTSLAAIAVLMVAGLSAFRAVVWAAALAGALSFIRRETALTPIRLLAALRAGATGVLGVIATTATAGIIVGVVTLTGLGLKIAGLIVGLAGGHLFLTVLYSAVAVWMLGLAVPVTASYIIAAVMVAPALVQSGVPLAAAHMFIFYYAVLSEVSPPTALSPFAAAALTGGNPFKTMMLTWKYTLPAFLVPFAFTLTPEGAGLLLQAGGMIVLWTAVTAAIGIAAFAAAFGGWIVAPANLAERVVMGAAGALLFFADLHMDLAGLGLGIVVLVLHRWRHTQLDARAMRG
ncbi:MAG TPA: TRAP transporter fused permease subunit [Vicinamibacterales bacterium]|nr:TRAP transporter fused permease subunit [Vicinamibacterales bacterium]